MKKVMQLSGKLAVQAVRTEMARRGWGVGELAAHCGVGKNTMIVRLSKGLPDRRLRLAIEAVFSWDLSLGSDERTLEFRRRCHRALGFDPYTTDMAEFRKHCDRLNVRDWKMANTREALLDLFTRHLAANPTLLKRNNEYPQPN